MAARKRDDFDDDEQEFETVLFQGATNGVEVDLAANARLARAGLVPSKNLVTNALNRRAEMIVLEPKGNAALVRFFIDGVAYPGAKLPRQQGLAITQMMKLLAGLDIQQRKKPQAGGINAEIGKVKYNLKVESIPIAEGTERLIVRAQNKKSDIESPTGAGLSDELRKKIRELASRCKGAILVCGPPNSGTTTTSYAVLRSVDAYMLSIFSIADMGGRDVMHVTIFEMKPEDSYEETIERIDRIDAQILFVDPISNAEAARRVFETQKKMCVIAEFTAKDAAAGIQQLCQWVGDPAIVADGLSAIFSQKLVRLLCKDCRAAFRPNPKMLARIGLPPETKTLYRATTAPPPQARRPAEDDEEEEEYIPCSKCGGVGYLGRTGVFEMIEMTDPIKKLVLEKADLAALRDEARKEEMPTLLRAGLQLVAEGKTSLEELQRAFKSQ